MQQPGEVRQRDDGMFDVVTGDIEKGPFPTRTFAAVIAERMVPEPKRAPRFRRFKIVREVLHCACT
ncbi:hypothetical protein HAP47_0020565 [Bradyrhizobium sp. 41S5]|uniref:hypothetical protein n=1 Tax=Bradyrhizobium sp. 41S5 TaxID=1404443 RepID=UPI001595C12E|nr:hypothetical protein [Bradyrhizobium sp. 41S5]UFX41707.1 hypothetical protein HAP47_0020565 [Bradyrhizobium sp. 41S5]